MKTTLRELGVPFGVFEPTARNHLCDVEGVAVGHASIEVGSEIHTGVTVVRPHAGDPFVRKAFAGFFAGNGFGKFAGATQVAELGEIESLIGLTNTLAVGTVVQEIVRHHVGVRDDGWPRCSINAVVGETNDALLSRIESLPVKPEHVHEAIADLSEDGLAQGCVGAGTGTSAFLLKAGIGSAARVVPARATGEPRDHRVGVLMQANYGGFLTLAGRPMWRRVGERPFEGKPEDAPAGGSCNLLVATDAPLLPIQLGRLARRAVYGLVRTGAYVSHGSGDYALSWSTHPDAASEAGRPIQGRYLSHAVLDPFFAAVVESVEEALWNSLTSAEPCKGFRKALPALGAEEAKRIWDELA